MQFFLLLIKIRLLRVLVERSLATSADIIVGRKTFDLTVYLMKIRTESTLGVTIRVADVIAARFALSANCAYFTHITPP